ncbi:unnamed protein product [Prorocentrum cordatum]|uniref:Uncharacterized protein n=1 Tax=Prorocentrum cordatum TaxID=2364126 RepID=A0ABN9TWA8_9DINO|nr:unnamed protein product [Polarella glacialis]
MSGPVRSGGARHGAGRSALFAAAVLVAVAFGLGPSWISGPPAAARESRAMVTRRAEPEPRIDGSGTGASGSGLVQTTSGSGFIEILMARRLQRKSLLEKKFGPFAPKIIAKMEILMRLRHGKDMSPVYKKMIFGKEQLWKR